MFTEIKVNIKNRFRKQYLFYRRFRTRLNSIITSDKKYVRRKFKKNFNVNINLENPKRYNEHISKILLEYNDPLAVSCVDKYEVRNFVNNKIGGNILNDLYGVYSNVDDIKKDLPLFPNKFVLKATHGCGWNFICKDKNEIKWNRLRIELVHWMKSNFYNCQREKIYKNIKPRIICEKYLEDESGGLIDYKIHCFNGEPKFINVINDRYTNMRLNTYDLDWNFIDISFSPNYPNDKNMKIEKPNNFRDLIEYSKALSNEFRYVRVDYYIVNNRIIFGELTFTPGNGAYIFNENEDIYFGQYFNIECTNAK